MKLFTISKVIVVSLTVLTACKKEITIIPAEVIPNNPPGQFTITLDYLSWDNASISWTQPAEPDNDAVSYRVYLNDSLLISNLKERIFTFTGLKQLTPYSVEVIAYDDKEGQTASTLDFTTIKFDERIFLKKLDFGKIVTTSEQFVGQMAKGNDGGYVITGKTDQLVHGTPGMKLFAMKIDSLGNKIWTKIYGFTSYGGFVNITNWSGGYLLVCGAQLLKIDNNGDLLWEKSFSINDGFASAAVNGSGEIYLAGSSFRDSVNNRISAVLSKYDADGNLLWRKSYSPTIWDQFFDIKFASDGNLILLGMTDKNKISIGEYNANTKPFEYDYWVVRLTPDGTMLWDKIYHHEGSAFEGKIIETKEGNFVFTGASSGPYATLYCILQMIDVNGNTLWTYEDSANPTYAKSVAETKDNGFVVTGDFQLPYSRDFALFKFDKGGNMLWEKRYSESPRYITPKTVIPTDDGGYFINAKKAKPTYSTSEYDQIYIFKTDDLGEFN